jgi:hypothetical protein
VTSDVTGGTGTYDRKGGKSKVKRQRTQPPCVLPCNRPSPARTRQSAL